MLVSVFADAGHCPKKKVAGWGGWCKSTRGRKYKGGPLKGKVANSTEAELKGCVKAIALAIKTGIAQKGDTILLQCDNMGALHEINKLSLTSPKDVKSNINTSPNNKEALVVLASIIHTYAIYIKTRHVKGHKGNVTPRNAVNELCDNLATKGLQEARSNCNQLQ